jgi:hypothetical protein
MTSDPGEAVFLGFWVTAGVHTICGGIGWWLVGMAALLAGFVELAMIALQDRP